MRVAGAGVDRAEDTVGREQRPQHEYEPDRRAHRDPGRERDVPVAAVAELVRDDREHLGRRRLGDERVEEDDAARRAEPGDVCVQLRRPLARVGDEDLAHRHARVRGEPQHGVPELGVLERPEAVEDRLEHDRRDEAQQQDEQRGPDRGDDRPRAREDLRRTDEAGEPEPGQDRADRDRLDAVGRELPPRLAREAVRARGSAVPTSPTSSNGRSAPCLRSNTRTRTLFTTMHPRVGKLSSLDEGQVVRLTGSRTYGAEVQPSPDGSPVLILTPPTAAAP